MYKVKVNKSHYEVSIGTDGIQVNGNPIEWDSIKTGDRHFHILKDHASYRCEVLAADVRKKTFSIKVNNHTFELEVKDRFDELLHKLGMDKAVTHKVNTIKAPMPGLVLKILVAPGVTIQEGEPVLILEAMKMENMIRSPGSGTVKVIKVKEKDAVEKNQELIELT